MRDPRDSGCHPSYRQRARPPLPRAAMAGRLRRGAAVSLAPGQPPPRALEGIGQPLSCLANEEPLGSLAPPRTA